MNWVPWAPLNASASWKLMPKKRPAIASQKGEPPASSITPRSSASDRVGEARAVAADEQIAAAREQHAEPAGALVGWRNRPPTSEQPSKSVHRVSISARKVRPSSGEVWVSVLIR